MSTPYSNPEKGCYYAEGDPPGTVRLWNGTQWVGFPQRDPNFVPTGPATKPFTMYAGQVRLKPFALAAKIALGLIACSYALNAAWAFAFLATSDGESRADALFSAALEDGGTSLEAEQSITALDVLFGLGAVLIVPAIFLTWFWRAYANMDLWHENEYEGFWAVLAWFVPFLNLRRPWRMVLELLEHSADHDRDGDINPIWGMVWWLCFYLPLVLTSTLVFGFTSDPIDVFENVEDLATGIVLAMAVNSTFFTLAAVCMIVIIHKVTAQQDQRLVPTDAQVELWEREQAEAATLVTNHNRLPTNQAVESYSF